MLSTLLLTLLTTVSASNASMTWVKDNQIHVTFYDLTKIYGPLKFYVAESGYPAAGCATCPTGCNAEYVVPPEMVYQTWPQGGKYLEVTFPASAIGNLQNFCFTAVSITTTEEKFLGTGVVPNVSSTKGRQR